MVTLVHIAPAATAARIRRSGIKAASATRLDVEGLRRTSADVAARFAAGGVYAFPRLGSPTLTYQWAREIARFHVRQPLVAVTFRIHDDESVAVGHYGKGHRVRSASEAVGLLRGMQDVRGWEVFVPRRVDAAEIRSMRPVPRNTGWRYFPDSHGRAPHTCCVGRGEYRGAILQRRRPHEWDGPFPPIRVLLAGLAAATARRDLDPGADEEAAELMRQVGTRRGAGRYRGPLRELTVYADHPYAEVREYLAYAVSRWRTPGTDALLARLSTDPDEDVREAAESTIEDRAARAG